MLPFSISKRIQTPFQHQNTTSDGNGVMKRTGLPVLPHKDDVLTEKSLHELYHEAYLLLKDVINTRKLNKNNSTMNIHNNASSSGQSNLLGQSPLPPFKTRQKNSTLFPVVNVSTTPQIYTSKISNGLNLNRSTNQTNGFFKISTVNQANFVQTLLGKKWIYNKQSNQKSLENKTKQLQSNGTQWNSRNQLFHNDLNNNKWPKNTGKNFTNVPAAIFSKGFKVVPTNGINKLKDNHIDPNVNLNSSRFRSLEYNPAKVIPNLDTSDTSSSSRKYMIKSSSHCFQKLFRYLNRSFK